MEEKKNPKVPDGFPARFNQFLKHFDLNANSLAAEIPDVAPVQFWRYSVGKTDPNASTLYKIAQKYPVNLNWLLLGQGPMLRLDEMSPEGKIQMVEVERLSSELSEVKKERNIFKNMLIKENPKLAEGLNFKMVTRKTTGRLALRCVDSVNTFLQRFNEKPEEREVAITYFGIPAES